MDIAILIDCWLILYLSYIGALFLNSLVIMARAKCSNSFEFFDNLEKEIASRGDGMLRDNHLSRQWKIRMHELDRREKELREREFALSCGFNDKNHSLFFSDVLVKRQEFEFVTSVYRKPTFNGQYMR